MNKIIACSGYFIWPHVGHIQYFKKAAKYGDVVVIVNNDEQQKLKYGRVIVPLEERMEVLRDNKNITLVIPSIDKDRTVCKTLEQLKPDYFGKGGDSNTQNVPEMEVCRKIRAEVIFSLGEKIQSSSWLLNKLKDR